MLDLPLPDTLDEGGYMPVSQAAYWIAVKASPAAIYPFGDEQWAEAFRALLPRMASGEVKTCGVRGNERLDVPPATFAMCPVALPFSGDEEFRLSTEPYLLSYPYVDDQHWRSGLNDQICSRSKKLWTHLQVLQSDVKRYWPPLPNRVDWMRDVGTNVRDGLLAKVRGGKFSPEQAEAVAERLGVGPFTREPNPEDYNPRQQSHWTMPMIVAWIMGRDINQVRRQMDSHRAECWFWRQSETTGSAVDGTKIHNFWLLENEQPASVLCLKLSQIFDDGEEASAHTSAPEAVRALWQALQKGCLIADGIDPGVGRRVEIPPREWHDLKLLGEDRRPNSVRALNRIGLPGHGYDCILISQDAVLHKWPETEKRHVSRAGAEGRAQAWFASQMRASPDVKVSTRDEAIQQAIARFDGLSERAGKRAWTSAIQETGALAWNAGGRPKKRCVKTGAADKL